MLVHKTPKPGHKCVDAVADHFAPQAVPPQGWLARRRQRGDVGQVVWCPRAKALLGTASELGLPSREEGVTPTIMVVGDRLATDMILATRLAQLRSPGTEPVHSTPLGSATTPHPAARINVVSVLTTTLHAREGLGTTFLRTLEQIALWSLTRFDPVPPSPWQACILNSSPYTKSILPPTSTIVPSYPRLSYALATFVPRLEALVALWTPPPPPPDATAARLAWRSPNEEVRNVWQGGEQLAERVVSGAEGRVNRLRRHGVLVSLKERLDEARARQLRNVEAQQQIEGK